MRLRIAAAALAIGLCTAGVATADEVPPEFRNRPPLSACYNAVPTIVGAGFITGTPLPDVILGSNEPDTIVGLGATTSSSDSGATTSCSAARATT
ncbi:hypothetical protein V1227_14710 [Lentzea sp. DG1S-22]|uniref:hypothetical protein n=1 Tax=Lentzea sp. DG1S-22 TaxID=3108822 RepID=UPI002E77948A|nr:hypothetical protein [Lentzea sp. DG1S-22]WVH85120.1 hypothetical protein V1227_14710 [Lentzea sp. DG1S-22]